MKRIRAAFKMVPLFVVFLTLTSFVSSCSSSSQNSGLGEYSEQIARCKEEALSYLNQPSTAQWQEISVSSEEFVQRLEGFPDGTYKHITFTGSVKSQNAFGAMLLTYYECTWPYQPVDWAYEEAGWGDGFWFQNWKDGETSGNGEVWTTTIYDN